MRYSSYLDWLSFMHTPNDYRVSLNNLLNTIQIKTKVPNQINGMGLFIIAK